MRTIGMFVGFILALTCVVQGAYLIKLSHRVTELTDELRADRNEAADPRVQRAIADSSRQQGYGASGQNDRRQALRIPTGSLPSVPVFVPTAVAPAPPAAGTLHEALSTPEGREHLKNALATIDEEKRQDKMTRRVGKDDERSLKFKENIVGRLGLNAQEQYKLDTLLATAQNERRQLVEDMKVGLKKSGEVDEGLDAVQSQTEKDVRALVGEDRWQKLRGGDRRGRQGGAQDGNGGGNGAGNGGGNGAGNRPPGTQQGQPPGSR